MEKKISQQELRELARELAGKIVQETGRSTLSAYAIPRGGVPAALALNPFIAISLTDDPDAADILVDDIIDSGATQARWKERYPGKPFFALIDKTKLPQPAPFIIWPWEGADTADSVEDNVVRLIQAVGDNPTRGGLEETPRRVVKAWQFWCSGYGQDPAEVLKVFEDGAEGYDQMITVKDIPIYSHCEHHLAAIFGTATISYIPDGRIVGLSKLSRLADIFARRLQVQERLTCQIADALVEHLKPKGVGVVIKARHMCMESRGVCQQGHHTVTTALRGAMLEEPATRAEFLNLAR